MGGSQERQSTGLQGTGADRTCNRRDDDRHRQVHPGAGQPKPSLGEPRSRHLHRHPLGKTQPHGGAYSPVGAGNLLADQTAVGSTLLSIDAGLTPPRNDESRP